MSDTRRIATSAFWIPWTLAATIFVLGVTVVAPHLPMSRSTAWLVCFLFAAFDGILVHLVLRSVKLARLPREFGVWAAVLQGLVMLAAAILVTSTTAKAVNFAAAVLSLIAALLLIREIRRPERSSGAR